MSQRNLPDIDAQTKPELLENAIANGLGAFLRVPSFNESFRKFLKAEFTLENLKFYEKVSELLEMLNEYSDEDGSPELRCSVAGISYSRLFDEFLRPGAASELNLISDLRVDLAMLMAEVNNGSMADSERTARGFLQRLTKTLTKAQDNIFQLMTNDMFNRYVLSKHYNELLESVKAEEG